MECQDGKYEVSSTHSEGEITAILYVGIDLAKNVFAFHGVDEHGKASLVRPSVARAKLHELIATLTPCTVGIEACSGARHWAPLFAQHDHTVRLMAPKLVAPYRMSGKRGKNDAADAIAVCEAVQRPNMRFVPFKSQGQAGAPVRAPRPPGPGRAAQGDDQPYPRPALGVRRRAGAEGSHRASRGRLRI